MKRFAKDFFTTNSVKAVVKALARSLARSLGLSGLIIAAATASALAQKKYDTGATDTTIKIGNTIPYSGPASATSAIAKSEAAYFKMLNEQGGVNGRKIEFLSLDDAYNPAACRTGSLAGPT
jgi:branched-chain amino acid transport system substrate-binding protein